jgi:hypothetical protein
VIGYGAYRLEYKEFFLSGQNCRGILYRYMYIENAPFPSGGGKYRPMSFEAIIMDWEKREKEEKVKKTD